MPYLNVVWIFISELSAFLQIWHCLIFFVTCSVQEPVQLVVEDDSLRAGHDEVDVEARSSQLNLSTLTAEISLPPSEDSVEMNGEEVENDDGLGLVQSDTPLAPVDGQNMQSASNLTTFSVSQ